MRQKLLQKHDKKINLFLQSIKSEETKRVYIAYLQKYLRSIAASATHSNPRKIEDNIISFIITMKKDGKSYSAIHNYVTAILAFYKINDIVLNTDKICRFQPDKKKSNKDRAYTHGEILQLVNAADERMKTVILLLASTGMRIGAIPSLRLRNLDKIKLAGSESTIYKITVYEGFNEEYFTFCTPECANAIDNYLDMRKRYGEKFSANSILIREQFDIRDPFAISKPVKIGSVFTISNKLIDLAIRSGLRKREVLTESTKYLGSSFRKDVPIAHGFRKFFTTELVRKKVNPEIREMLLGHTIGLAGAYYKPDDDDFLQEYEKVLDNLTIDPTNRLQRTIETLKVEKSRIDELEAKIQKLERKHR